MMWNIIFICVIRKIISNFKVNLSQAFLENVLRKGISHSASSLDIASVVFGVGTDSNSQNLVRELDNDSFSRWIVAQWIFLMPEIPGMDDAQHRIHPSVVLCAPGVFTEPGIVLS